MALKKLEEKTDVKEDFVKNVGARTLTPPRAPRKLKNLDDEEATCFKQLVFGPTGSGKTYLLVALLLHGYSIAVLSTDLGGDGLSTVKAELKRIDRRDLIKNVHFITLETGEDINSFLREPADIVPDIYDYDIDFFVWDGFSSWQQIILPVSIGELASDKASSGSTVKNLAEVREEGLQFEIADWGVFKNYTIRGLDRFLKLNNRRTGKIWHKIVTCLEGIKGQTVKNGALEQTIYKETREPMLQGSAVKLIGPSFDLILNTKKIVDNGKASFKYIVDKERGLNLGAEYPADMYKLWEIIVEQLSLKKDAKGDTADV